MKKPAIFIDAFINNTDKKTIFDYNVSNFIKNNWDVFIISNKMLSFDKFSEVKYFEYDCNNRLLLNVDKYKLTSNMEWRYQLRYSNGVSSFLHGKTKMHGFTNWTILYNLKRICKVLKRFGYDYMIRYEYDVLLKDYNLMDTIFKKFGQTEKSKNCMILPGGFGCATNFFLINVDYLDSKIPDLETEEDYLNFMRGLYGDNISPVFENLFKDIIISDCEFLDENETYQYIENLSAFISETGDLGYRHKVVYKSLLMTPINDNTEFIIHNSTKNRIYVNYITYDETGNLSDTLHIIHPNYWVKMPCRKSVEIKTSEMPVDKSIIFDLSEPCLFTFTLN